jgi:hypothetical protein
MLTILLVKWNKILILCKYRLNYISMEVFIIEFVRVVIKVKKQKWEEESVFVLIKVMN